MPLPELDVVNLRGQEGHGFVGETPRCDSLASIDEAPVRSCDDAARVRRTSDVSFPAMRRGCRSAPVAAAAHADRVARLTIAPQRSTSSRGVIRAFAFRTAGARNSPSPRRWTTGMVPASGAFSGRTPRSRRCPSMQRAAGVRLGEGTLRRRGSARSTRCAGALLDDGGTGVGSFVLSLFRIGTLNNAIEVQ